MGGGAAPGGLATERAIIPSAMVIKHNKNLQQLVGGVSNLTGGRNSNHRESYVTQNNQTANKRTSNHLANRKLSHGLPLNEKDLISPKRWMYGHE